MSKKINSRSKGNRAELRLCRVLSAWWLSDAYSVKTKAEDLPFRRTPLSGGWDKKRAAMDLIVPKNCPFFVEVKDRESWDFIRFFTTEDGGELVRWYEKERIKDKCHILIFTRKRFPDFIMFDSVTSSLFPSVKIKELSLFVNGRWYFIFNLTEFLDNTKDFPSSCR